MPAKKKSVYTRSRTPDLQEPEALINQDTIATSRSTKNASARDSPGADYGHKHIESSSMAQHLKSSPPAASPTAILGRSPSTAHDYGDNDTFDAMIYGDPSHKVSDEHTPPVERWARPVSHARSGAEALPRPYTGTLTQYEPGFSTRGAFNPRSPPISPPVRKARPVSYGAGMPPLPDHRRISTSPYGQTAYGSPPALPHLPQQHFYRSQDVDLGLGPPQVLSPEPTPLKFSCLPGSGHENRQAVLMTRDGELNVVTYNGEKLEHMGGINGLQGSITDACLLTWHDSPEPFADQRPLIALVLKDHAREGEGGPEAHAGTYDTARAGTPETRVIVFSLKHGCEVAELLKVPASVEIFQGIGHIVPRHPNLSVHASGNFVAVSSSDSGELFIFTIRQANGATDFECIAKYWTTLQPHMPRRDSSSHGNVRDSDVSPADLRRDVEPEHAPILNLNGRLLAYCPATTASRTSVGAVLGACVIDNKTSNFNVGTAPSRPVPNCEVASPDIDTFLSKVAKGFAQEAVKGAKWIGDKGFQTWQSYWNKDSGTSSMPSTAPTSPPVYSPQLNIPQFPPTHAGDHLFVSKDPELVTVVDLQLLLETSVKKTAAVGSIATFQPPGGCSFLSFTPTGTGLFTANRRGDVYYVWDLLQMRYGAAATIVPVDGGRVRQVTRYERVSPSSVVDLAWDDSMGHRFALLTSNRTVHIFDLPAAAFIWPPPVIKKSRPNSAPIEPIRAEADPPPSGGFLASAMQLAGKTQPMIASLRGRAPSIGGGVSGVTPGFSSTSTIKSGSRAMAAGFTKSFGAASETVTSIRHANQSRLHLKMPATVGMISWLKREGRPAVCILDETALRAYHVRLTKPREGRQAETISVFDARKAVAVKWLSGADLSANYTAMTARSHQSQAEQETTTVVGGFWRSKAARESSTRMPHPLASAEIETNAPYQPFHSERKVTFSLISTDLPMFGSEMLAPSPALLKPLAQEQCQPDTRHHARAIPSVTAAAHVQNVFAAVPSKSRDIYAAGKERGRISGATSLGTTPTDNLDETSPQIFATKKKKGKKSRHQAQALEENFVLPSHLDGSAEHSRRDEDLLDPEELF